MFTVLLQFVVQVSLNLMSSCNTLTQIYNQPSGKEKKPWKKQRKVKKRKSKLKKPSLTITDYFMIDLKSIKKTTTKNGVTIWTNKGIPYCKCGGMRKGISKTKNNWKRRYYCCLKYRKSKTGKKKASKHCGAFIWNVDYIKMKRKLKRRIST